VDEQLVCVEMSGLPVPAAGAFGGIDDRLSAWLRQRFRARLARVRRLAARNAEAAARVERAISRHLASVGWPEEAQPGLFSGRAVQAFDEARNEVRDVTRDLAGRLAACEKSAVVQFEAPTIEAIFVAR
jgi:hypothetical protein